MRLRYAVVAVIAGLAAFVPHLARAGLPPAPEPNVAATLVPSACTPDAGNPYEQASYHADQWYGSSCQRLHFAYGPIHIRPGQNDVIISPVTIEKPAYDGYITRFKPNLVEADGTVPPIEKIHLHHSVWFTLSEASGGWSGGQAGPVDLRNYGEGPFFASGEEKTIFDLPQGYGFPINGTDNWQFLYMIHNQIPTPDTVWITYDVDYVAASQAPAAGLAHPAYPVWLDVRNGSFYPVFNVQRGYPTATSTSCTWPSDQCAAFDPYGQPALGQGQPGNGTGTPWTFPAAGSTLGRMTNFQGGTLVWMGGHLHPGGLTDNVDLERPGAGRTRILTSQANYWDGVADSWDLSMTTVSKPKWAVQVKPGDTLWISATYDTTVQSTYEDMGIVVSYFAPGDTSGLDPFTAPHDTAPGCPSGGLPAGTVCERGTVTHGHLPEADHKGGQGVGTVISSEPFAPSNQVQITGFNYFFGGQGTAATLGVPTVKAGDPVTFNNEDAAVDIYHSITACQNPCDGPPASPTRSATVRWPSTPANWVTARDSATTPSGRPSRPPRGR